MPATPAPATPAKFNLRALGDLPQFKAKIQTAEKAYHVQTTKDAKSTSYTVFVLTVLTVLSTTAAIVLFRYAGSPSNTVLFAPAGVFTLISAGLVAFTIKSVVESICRRHRASERMQKTMNGFPSYTEIQNGFSEAEVTVGHVQGILTKLQTHRSDFLKVCVQSESYEPKIAQALTPSDIQHLPRDLIKKRWALGILEHLDVKADKEGKAFRKLQHVVGVPANKEERKIYARFPVELAALCFRKKNPFISEQAVNIFKEMSSENQRAFLRAMKNLYGRKEDPLEKDRVWDFLVSMCKENLCTQEEATTIVGYFVDKYPREFTNKILSLKVADNQKLACALGTHFKGVTLVKTISFEWAELLLHYIATENQKVFESLFAFILPNITAATGALALFPHYLPSKRERLTSNQMAAIFTAMTSENQTRFLQTMHDLYAQGVTASKTPTKGAVWDYLLAMCAAEEDLSKTIISHFMGVKQGKGAFVSHVLKKGPSESLAQALAAKPSLLARDDITISREWASLLLKFSPTTHQPLFNKLLTHLNLMPDQIESDEALARFPAFLASRPLNGPDCVPPARLAGALTHMNGDNRQVFLKALSKRYLQDSKCKGEVWKKLSHIFERQECIEKVREEIITSFDKQVRVDFLTTLMTTIEPGEGVVLFFQRKPDLLIKTKIPRKWAVKLLEALPGETTLPLAKHALSFLTNSSTEEELKACAQHPLTVADSFGSNVDADFVKNTFTHMTLVAKARCLKRLGGNAAAADVVKDIYKIFLTPDLIGSYHGRFTNNDDQEAASLLDAFAACPEATAHQLFVAHPQLGLEFVLLTELMSVPKFARDRFTKYIADEWEKNESGIERVKVLLTAYGDARADEQFDPKQQLWGLFLDILKHCPQSFAGAYPDLATKKYLPFVNDAINKLASDLSISTGAVDSESRIMTFLEKLSEETRKGVLARFHKNAVIAYQKEANLRQLRAHWIVKWFKKHPEKFLSEFLENEAIDSDRSARVNYAITLLKAIVPIENNKIVEAQLNESAKQIVAILDALPDPKNIVEKILSTSPQKILLPSPEWYVQLCNITRDLVNANKSIKPSHKILACCFKKSKHAQKMLQTWKWEDWKNFSASGAEMDAKCFPPGS